MIKGILLGTTIAVFLTSLIFTIIGPTGIIKKNLVTGNVIGPTQLASYSIIPLIVSFLVGCFIFALIFMKKN